MNDKSKAPSFLALVDENKELSLDNFQGSYLVIYFYPKDKTSGCTIESQNFRDYKNKFSKKNCKIVGVSRDSIKSHKSFIEKESLNFPLLSDPDETMCNAYGVMKEKSMYGRKYMGIERSTFLISPDGSLIKEWRGVKVPGHVEEVYEFLSGL
ncbi:MAG: peroxiredoxin [Gammaproteobacteria bacterium]|mgnify:FL=1|uniref:thioredoxin-dependent peroxiredoxin n=1 Tax=SAR86 cluster bacterium TaxID=2030880 RepID=A0A520MSA3_9GAMM|nr:MAG: peroxiredoxin [SAR86 cluster bacterium]|tara:strand:+ start:498 stop:956 length:459 start_codon:yes stop_codon:yes gene_type:complete